MSYGTLPPAQLPADIPDFTGREHVIAKLAERLTTTAGNALTVVAVSGAGGIGKTTLALHVAHAVRGAFPDGQLHASLRGAGAAPLRPADVLADFLRALGLSDREIPSGIHARTARLRSALSGRRVLIVLDDAMDTSQVAPLIPGAATCAVLVTSRAWLGDLPGAHPERLDLFSREEALELLARVAGAERVAAQPAEAVKLVESCGLLPLAVRIVAARLAARPGMSVEVLASRLLDERRRLAELKIGGDAVESSFALGYAPLGADHARAFRLLALMDGPDLSVAAAAAVLDVSQAEAEDLCESLVDLSLLQSRGLARYRYHDLVRLYARGLAERVDSAQERTAASDRLLDHYLAGIRGVCRVSLPGFVHQAGHQAPELTFADAPAARDWVRAEQANVSAAIEQAGRSGTRALAEEVPLLTEVTGLSDLDDRIILGAVLMALGLGALRVRGPDEATSLLSAALTVAEAQDSPRLAASVHGLLAMTLGDAGFVGEARAHVAQGLRLAYEIDDAQGIGVNLLGAAAAAFRSGDMEEAIDSLLRSAQAYRDGGLPLRAAWAAHRLMDAYRALGRHEEAVQVGEEALPLYQSMNDPLLFGCVLSRLGQAWTDLGDPDRALRCWKEADAILGPYDVPEGRAVRRRLGIT
ncbi:NB-ARC domain-containing protein [Nonomuraea sp. NPDC000554]|uniref:ATP-binding protein n=1 Tax=Nonomuraea sp. NPDC000554 TaxID=3154259 RepID=UPI00331A7D9A